MTDTFNVPDAEEIFETPPVRLEMHQAGRGDLLRIHRDPFSVIIDSGTASQMPTLHRFLTSSICEALILTHLDADHFGGLHALVQQYADGGAKTIRWPKTILVNDFEPQSSVGAVLTAAGENAIDRSPAEVIDEFISAGEAWREGGLDQQSVVVAPEESGDTPFIVETDEAAFEYIAAASFADRTISREASVVREVLQGLRERIARDDPWYREIQRIVRRLEWEFATRSESESETGRNAIVLDGGNVLLRRRQDRRPGIRVMAQDHDVAAEAHATRSIPRELPPAVRGVIHLAQRGTHILKSRVRPDAESLTFIEALRHLPGVKLADARAGNWFLALEGKMRVRIVGPDDTELGFLEKKWKRIRERGRIHMRRRHMAFLEATFFAADAGRYDLDTSVTNRSSIQMIAETERGYALLTGDGRPDTLERTLRFKWPSVPCRVFKAAHHGSPHNIQMNQEQNAILTTARPGLVWISGGDIHHPALDFLNYLRRQQDYVQFDISVTNANEHVQAVWDRLPIRVMENDQPFECNL